MLSQHKLVKQIMDYSTLLTQFATNVYDIKYEYKNNNKNQIILYVYGLNLIQYFTYSYRRLQQLIEYIFYGI